MTRVVLDAPTCAKFNDPLQIVEICNEAGEVIGHFVPKIDLSQYDLEPDISDEELQRRINSNEPRYTTAEVIAYLESLP